MDEADEQVEDEEEDEEDWCDRRVFRVALLLMLSRFVFCCTFVLSTSDRDDEDDVVFSSYFSSVSILFQVLIYFCSLFFCI